MIRQTTSTHGLGNAQFYEFLQGEIPLTPWTSRKGTELPLLPPNYRISLLNPALLRINIRLYRRLVEIWLVAQLVTDQSFCVEVFIRSLSFLLRNCLIAAPEVEAEYVFLVGGNVVVKYGEEIVVVCHADGFSVSCCEDVGEGVGAGCAVLGVVLGVSADSDSGW